MILSSVSQRIETLEKKLLKLHNNQNTYLLRMKNPGMKISNSEEIKIAVISQQLEYIKSELAEIKIDIKSLRGDYVLKEEFLPIKNIVYGLVALMASGIVAALLGLVIKK